MATEANQGRGSSREHDDGRETGQLVARREYWEFWGPKLEWAERELPGESAPMAASAFQTLARHWGRRPTAAEVLARLEAQGRTAAQLEDAPPAA